MRCPECNRFVSYGEQEPEIEVDNAQGSVLPLDVRLILPCDECSTELKEHNEHVEIDLSQEFDFSLRPGIRWGEFKIFDSEYYARRSYDPESEEWIVAVYRIAREWVSGPRDRYGRPDHENAEAVYERKRKFLAEFKQGGRQDGVDVLFVLMDQWALPLWETERFNIDVEDVEFSSDYKGAGRYTQTFYGADFKVKVVDRATDKEHVYPCHVQEQASSFNECC